ncbi:MAG: F0F1 ATP synthase subunit gamma [Streptococcaceae bacterium]|jgi:F-type H+-transporting ATPase subunit gamma|nr:F0F1 ATP synthase subunit gamma [Streptococcaceae bacterium]
MDASLNDIKGKIASTKKTSQITSAMQMVSAAKLTKSEQLSRNFQVYASKIRAIVTRLVALQLDEQTQDNDELNIMLANRKIKKTGYIVITSDKGLVGSYNSSVLKKTLGMIKQDHDSAEEYLILAIGGVGADFFRSRKMEIAYELRGVADHPSFDEVRQIVGKAITMYQKEVFDELYVCYNHHVNSLTAQFRVEKMLPISDLDPKEVEKKNESYLLEPSKNEILAVLLPQYAESLIFGVIIDAKTAEYAAGMTAMRTATDNAKNIISKYTIIYNRARQATITQEITEIVAGAVALE